MSNLSGRTVDGIRQWLATPASGKPGFQRRREQDRAIYAITRALEPDGDDAVRVVALEGPTGIGKSVATLSRDLSQPSVTAGRSSSARPSSVPAVHGRRRWVRRP